MDSIHLLRMGFQRGNRQVPRSCMGLRHVVDLRISSGRAFCDGIGLGSRLVYSRRMNFPVEFDQIEGRFKPINDILGLCRERGRVAKDPDYLALVRVVQALSNEVRNLERNLLLAEPPIRPLHGRGVSAEL